MTVGKPFKLVVSFAFPILLGFLFQQVYSVVDTIIVGKCLGVDALAAVGSTGSIYFLVIGFCMGMCSGFSLPVAQKFGAKDYRALRKFVGNSAVLSGIVGIIITFFTVVFCRQILTVMNTPEDIIDMAYIYIVVIFAGIPATILYNMLSGYLRSLGDSVTPLVFLVISSFLNIGLDLLFIITFKWGIFGATFATVLSQAISGFLCLAVIIKKYDILHLEKNDWKLEKSYVKTLIVMGFPMGFQYSITAIGSTILQAAVNSLGSLVVASMTAAVKVYNFLGTPFDSLGSTMATYGGQNVGAGKLDRLSKGVGAASVIGCVYSVIILGVLYLYGQYFVGLFVSADQTVVIAQAKDYLLVQAMFFIPLVFVNVVRFMIQGMGYSGFAVFAGVLEMIGRSVVGIVFVPIWGLKGAAFAGPLAWLLADAFLIPAYFHVLKKLKRIKNEGNA